MLLASLSLCFALTGATEADTLIAEGVKLRETKQDGAALKKFKAAYRLSRSARAMAQIGLAEQALGRWIQAETHLTAAMERTENRWVRKYEVVLRQALNTIQKKLGHLEVAVTVEGASVYVNGRRVGFTPLSKPTRVVAGSVAIKVKARGYLPATRTIEVAPGMLARERFRLTRRIRSSEVPQRDEPAAQDHGTVRPSATVDSLATQRPPTDTGRSLAPYGYATAGAAVVAAGAGLALRLIGQQHADEYNACLVDRPTQQASCRAERNAGERAEIASIASFAGAGALAVVSALLFALDAPEPSSQTAQQPQCDVGPGLVGVACRVHF